MLTDVAIKLNVSGSEGVGVGGGGVFRYFKFNHKVSEVSDKNSN